MLINTAFGIAQSNQVFIRDNIKRLSIPIFIADFGLDLLSFAISKNYIVMFVLFAGEGEDICLTIVVKISVNELVVRFTESMEVVGDG